MAKNKSVQEILYGRSQNLKRGERMKDLPRIKEKYRVSMENINGISIVAVDELDLKYLIEQAEKLERYEKVAKKAMETGYE